MANNELLNKIEALNEWEALMEEAKAEAEAIRDSIKITQIQPSLTGSLQSMVIPTFGSNEEGAYAFMNFMLSPEAQEIMVRDMAAIPLIDSSNMDMTGYEDLQGLDVSNFRIQSIGGLSTSFNERWDNEIGSIG